MRTRIALASALLVLVIPAGVALAKKAGITAPTQAHVGDTVRVGAHDLKRGRYALTLSADGVAGKDTACVARLAHARNRSTSVYLSGDIPASLTCWTNDKVRQGEIPVTPGRYHLIIGVPDGPSGFRGTFLRAAIAIKG